MSTGLTDYSTYNLDEQIERLRRCEHLSEAEVHFLCAKAREILLAEPNILRLSSPITICGDIHGQFYDLHELFSIGGECPDTNYLFLGDWVDRGFYSIETLLWLIALKVRYPNRIFLIRGNHESRQITQIYGFYDESLRKYGSVSVWTSCSEVFDSLPLGALIDDTIFCVHGGLSPSISTLSEIDKISRVIEVPHEGPMCDLLWSDPLDEQKATKSDDGQCDVEGEGRIGRWVPSQRGAGYIFDADVVERFNYDNQLDLICRAHQLVMDGYKYAFNQRLVTVWSAPNYCYRAGNVAAILELNEFGERNFKIFEAAPKHKRASPDRKPIPDYFL